MGIKRKKALILLNDTAGIGKAGQNTWTIIRKFAQEGYETVVYPIIPGTDLVSEKILDDYKECEADLVVCSGGDGTLNHVIQKVMSMNTKPLLAYEPSSSGFNRFKSVLIIAALVVKLQKNFILPDIFSLKSW